MRFSFELELRDTGSCATIYSFRKDGHERSEIEKFWKKPDVQGAPDYNALRTRLYHKTEGLLHSAWWDNPNLRTGDYRTWFRDESAPHTSYSEPHVEALSAPIPQKDLENLPEPPPSLRLYLYHVDYSSFHAADFDKTQIFIIGNGGVKDVPRPQDKAELKSALNEIRYVKERVVRRIKDKRLTIVEDGFELEGEMYFPQLDQPI